MGAVSVVAHPHEAAHRNSRFPPTKLDLHATDGATVSLKALGAGRTVLYIYPLTGRPGTGLPEGWDSIPGARGCTAETCGFRDHRQDLLAAGATQVYGLSSQDSDYQREVTERLRLPFQMLSDPARSLAQALDLARRQRRPALMHPPEPARSRPCTRDPGRSRLIRGGRSPVLRDSTSRSVKNGRRRCPGRNR
ncbi:peroxiredoxin [Streptomyces bryophytorum]|nr:peroxiredoxin [Actinacidiphila bryophytorum]MBN6542117.1 peroxiredoxin [Actinacidiphila bryophytorum]